MSPSPSIASNARRIERTALATAVAALGVGFTFFAAAIGVALLRWQLTLTALVVESSPLGTAIAIGLGILFGVVGWDWLGVGAFRLVTRFGYNLLGSPEYTIKLREMSEVRRVATYYFVALFLGVNMYQSAHRFARLAPVVGGDGQRVFDWSHSAGSVAVLLLDLYGAFGVVFSVALVVAGLGATVVLLDDTLATGDPPPVTRVESPFVPRVVRERESADTQRDSPDGGESASESENNVDWQTVEPETRANADDFLVRLCAIGVVILVTVPVVRVLARVTPSLGVVPGDGDLLALAVVFSLVSLLRGVHIRAKVSEWTPSPLARLGSVVGTVRRVALCENTGTFTRGVVVTGYLTVGIWLYLSALTRLPASRSRRAPLLRAALTGTGESGVSAYQLSAPVDTYAEITRIGAVFLVCAALPLVVSWGKSVRRSQRADQARSFVGRVRYALTTPIRVLEAKTELTGEDANLTPWSFWIKTTFLVQLLVACLTNLAYLRQNPVVPGIALLYVVGVVQATSVWRETAARDEYDTRVGKLVAVSVLLLPIVGGSVYVLRNY